MIYFSTLTTWSVSSSLGRLCQGFCSVHIHPGAAHVSVVGLEPRKTDNDAMLVYCIKPALDQRLWWFPEN